MFNNFASFWVLGGVNDMVRPYFPYTERRLLIEDQDRSTQGAYRAEVISSTPSRWNFSSAYFDIASEY
jgi:hypothetical protein